MKLLKINEIKDEKELQVARDIRRTSTVKSTLKEATRELDETKARFDLMLAGQRTRWAQEEKEATDQIAKLANEVRILQKQREEALIPYDIVKKNAYTLLQEAEKALLEAENKKKEVDSMAETLQERLDEVSDRETIISQKEKTIEVKEKAIESQSLMTKELSQKLNEKWQEFFKENDLKLKELNDTKTSLVLRERTIESKEEELRDRAKVLDLEKSKIASQREALKAAQTIKIG